MKHFPRIMLFSLLALIAGAAQAHSGHGGAGLTHSTAGIEQLLVAFVLAMIVYQSARLAKRHSITLRLEAFIKRLKNRLP